MTEQTWPENTKPTAEQWLDWLLTLDRAAQMEQAENVMANADRAHLCLIANHEGLAEQLRATQDYAARAYQDGATDAATQIRDLIAEEPA